MHRIAATPGGWNPDISGIISIEQNPGSICLLTPADTEVQTLAASISSLPANFPTIRVVNLLQLQQQLSIDNYTEKVLSLAKVIILRLLGGRSYWSYGLEVVKAIVEVNNIALFVLPGDDRPDPYLFSHCNVSLSAVNSLWQYFIEGGVDNLANGLKFVADLKFKTAYNPPPPQRIPKIGIYQPNNLKIKKNKINKSLNFQVGLLFYRAHYLAGNLRAIDALCQALEDRNLKTIPIFISSLRDKEVQNKLSSFLSVSFSQENTEVATQLLQNKENTQIEILIDTTSFSVAKISNFETVSLWQKLNVPILQAISSSSSLEYWESSYAGLTPRDVAMNVALPEVDGRIITRAISFKSVANWNEALETDIVVYQPKSDRISFVSDLAANWVKLRQTPPQHRKIALILANYPNKDGRIANGVGLDTPASCLEILRALQQNGYLTDGIPANSDELIKLLTAGITNDLEVREQRSIRQYLSKKDYQTYFATLPEKIQQQICDRWGNVPTEQIAIPGIQLGNIFIGIQPSRGYDRDPSLNYHAPDLEPTHDYLAYYYWLRQVFKVSAIVHLGKHGNLEWLPGKSLALSAECYPEIALGSIPNLYPFIVNDPGEGSQAKRRSSAAIIDHLTPPMTRAEIYGDLAKLETLIDEYYEAQTLDPSRLKPIGDRITKLIEQTNLDLDLGIKSELDNNSLAQFLTIADGYLCELKEAQIRDGLHIFGQCPQNKQFRDLIISIARFPSLDRLGLTKAIAKDFNLDFNPLTADPTTVITPNLESTRFKNCRNFGDAIATIEQIAAETIDDLLQNRPIQIPGTETAKELKYIQNQLIPALQNTEREITNLLKGLNGEYVPSGPSGAPTRGRADVLPTGRNFYSVDIRAIPTETAWDIGRKAAEVVIERYTQENGEYPQTLAISVWGTSTMRTGGDDIAQVLALLGVQPVWDGLSRRVVDFEILPVSVLGRPRVDVTLRISGFFRDSFPNLIDLVYNAIASVSDLDEPEAINPLAARVKCDREFWQKQGLDSEKAKIRATHRIFGSKPGAYGAGLQGLIEAQNWSDDRDLARAYINWSSYAYTADGKGDAAPEAFTKRLQELQIVLHNQDNREHDLLDSDDYYQFQGGLTAAVRALTGKNPTTYFGDNSIPANPRVRQLKEEIARVYRSRVVNPKWIDGVMRHGYKGAFEMAATLDYLFAYDATARCVEDFMYRGVADAYIFDNRVQDFIKEKNPWVLRDMAERLLEASQRGLWQSVSAEIVDDLKAIVNDTEGVIEELDRSNF